MQHIFWVVFISFVVLFGVEAKAAPFDVTPVGETWNTCTSCTTFEGRSIYIRANETFTVDRVEWYGNISSGSYDVVIWEGLGEAAALGSQLAIGTATLVGGVLEFNQIDINFTFTSGSEYLVNMRRTDGTAFSSNFHYLSWGNGAQESNLGLLTLLDGRHGFAPDTNNNSWTTHFLFDVVDAPVPVPTLSEWALILLLMLIATSGYMGIRRRQS